MSKVICIFLGFFLLQSCSKNLTNVGYDNFNFDSSSIKEKTPIYVEKNMYCLLLLCNRYDYGKYTDADDFIYEVIKKNQDKGNAITDIDINIEMQNFIFYIHKKITLTGNMFYDTSSQP